MGGASCAHQRASTWMSAHSQTCPSPSPSVMNWYRGRAATRQHLVQRVRLALVDGQTVSLPDRDHPGREPAAVLRRQPLGRVVGDLLVAIHARPRQRQVQQVAREATPGRWVCSAQAAVVRLGPSHHVLDVRVGLARKPTPRVRTVDPAQLVDDPILHRLRISVIVRVVGRAASFRRDDQTAPGHLLRMERAAALGHGRWR